MQLFGGNTKAFYKDKLKQKKPSSKSVIDNNKDSSQMYQTKDKSWVRNHMQIGKVTNLIVMVVMKSKESQLLKRIVLVLDLMLLKSSSRSLLNCRSRLLNLKVNLDKISQV